MSGLPLVAAMRARRGRGISYEQNGGGGGGRVQGELQSANSTNLRQKSTPHLRGTPLRGGALLGRPSRAHLLLRGFGGSHKSRYKLNEGSSIGRAASSAMDVLRDGEGGAPLDGPCRGGRDEHHSSPRRMYGEDVGATASLRPEFPKSVSRRVRRMSRTFLPAKWEVCVLGGWGGRVVGAGVAGGWLRRGQASRGATQRPAPARGWPGGVCKSLQYNRR